MSRRSHGSPADPDAAAGEVRALRNWLFPSAALSVVRSGAGSGFLSLPGHRVPKRVQRAWLVVMWHHRLAWHMPAGRVLGGAGPGVLVYRGRTARGIRFGATMAFSAAAVASVMLLYLAAAAAPGLVLFALLRTLGLAEAVQIWRPVYGLALLAGTFAVAMFVMSRSRHPGLRREALLYGLAGEAGWVALVVAADGPTRPQAQRALIAEWVARAAAAQGVRRVVIDSCVLSDASTLPPHRFAKHRFEEGWVFVADLSGSSTAEPTGGGRSTIGLGLLAALVPTALVLVLLVTQVVLPAELRSRPCVTADNPADAGCMQDVWDALYWGVTTATTTGYGDLRPHSTTARWAALTLMLFGVTFWGALISVLVTALQQEAAERDAAARRLSARIYRPGDSGLRDELLDELLDLRRRFDELPEQAPAAGAAKGPSGAADPSDDRAPAGSAPGPPAASSPQPQEPPLPRRMRPTQAIRRRARRGHADPARPRPLPRLLRRTNSGRRDTPGSTFVG